MARSLIVFSNIPYLNISDEEEEKHIKILSSAAAFHYKKFLTYNEASEWFSNNFESFKSSDESLIQFSVDASNPYQFISKVLCLKGTGNINLYQIPITQDASASAYQIMAYFLLDFEIAMKTNLIPTDDNRISDIYIFFLEELRDYLRKIYDVNVSSAISSLFTRKLIKQLFMPLIYGKTIISMANDLNRHCSSLLSQKECMTLAFNISEFFKDRFPGIVNLMELVRSVSWVISAGDNAVVYNTPLLITVQDYMKSEIVKLWVYDRIQKKRHQVSLRIPTTYRDRRKTNAATFANFIHQKDANIAVFMILEINDRKDLHVPVYTVHDNFITIAPFAKYVSDTYIKIYAEGREPLYYINYFLILNLAGGHSSYSMDKPLPLDYIYKLLTDLVPSNLNNNKNKVWDKKIESVITAYNYYVNKVCKEDDKYIFDYKWDRFKNKMYNWKELSFNYSLHL